MIIYDFETTINQLRQQREGYLNDVKYLREQNAKLKQQYEESNKWYQNASTARLELIDEVRELQRRNDNQFKLLGERTELVVNCECQKLKEQITTLEEEIKELKKRNDVYKEEFNKLEAEYALRYDQVAELEKDNKRLVSWNQSYDQENEVLKEKVANLEKHIDSLEYRIRSARAWLNNENEKTGVFELPKRDI